MTDSPVLLWFVLGKNPNQALDGNGTRQRFLQHKPGSAREKGLLQGKQMLARGLISTVSKRVFNINSRKIRHFPSHLVILRKTLLTSQNSISSGTRTGEGEINYTLTIIHTYSPRREEVKHVLNLLISTETR